MREKGDYRVAATSQKVFVLYIYFVHSADKNCMTPPLQNCNNGVKKSREIVWIFPCKLQHQKCLILILTINLGEPFFSALKKLDWDAKKGGIKFLHSMCTLQLTSIPMILCVLYLLNFAFGIEEKKISEQNYVLLRWNSSNRLVPRAFPPELFPQHGRLSSNFKLSLKTSPGPSWEKHSPGFPPGMVPPAWTLELQF